MRKLKYSVKIEKIMAVILCLYLLFFPWILWKKELLFTKEERIVLPETCIGILDTALYGKAFVTIFIGIIFSFLLFYRYFRQKKFPLLKQQKNGKLIGILLGIVALESILSALFGGHWNLSFLGNVNSCEGLPVWLAYMVLFLAATETFSHTKYRIWLKRTLLLLCYITTFLTSIEFFYQPILKLIFPDIWNTQYPNMSVLTLYNPGYYALFCTLLFAVAGGLWLEATNLKEEIITGIALYGMIFCIITSKSTGALYVMLVESLMLLAAGGIGLYRKHKQGEKVITKRLVCKGTITVILLLLFGLANLFSDGKLSLIATEASTNETRALHETEYFKLTDILLDGNKIDLIGEKHTFTAEINTEGAICFYDERNERIPFTEDEGHLNFTGDFSLITAWVEDNALTLDLEYRDTIHFYMHQGNFYPMLSNGSIISDISGNGLWKNTFSGFATGRGWFWLGSLSILQQCILLGHGMGTFQVYFKQYDFVGLLNSQGTVELIVDKPHNLYIQTAVQSGIVAAVALIGFILIIIANILHYLRIENQCPQEHKVEELKGFQFGLLLAIIAFAVLSIITDSSVAASPLAWILMGAATANSLPLL